MKRMRLAPTLLFGLALAPGLAVSAIQQDAAKWKEIWKESDQSVFTLAELMKGDRLPLSLKPSELPDGFRAFRIRASGESGFSDLIESPLGLLMMMPMSGGGREAASMKLFELLDLTWTKGDVVHIITALDRKVAEAQGAPTAPPGGWEDYLVTYKADLSLADISGISDHLGQLSGVPLKLHLVKFKSITGLTPEPTYTKEKLAEALGEAGASVEKEPSARDQAKRTVALSNAKQIGLAMLMYATDYDDALPYVQSTAEAKKVTEPYYKNADIWNTMNPKSQFRFNMCLSGVSQTSIPEVAATPLLYESAPYTDGTRIVVFTDGHAKKVPETEWQSMAKYLKLKLPRPGAKPPRKVAPGPAPGRR